MTKKEFYQNKLNQFLDSENIQTGHDLNNEHITLVYDNKLYNIVEKLNYTALLIKNKGIKNNDFMKFFEDIGELDYQENYVYCDSCGNYAYTYNDYHGINDQYYINDCQVICKNCLDNSDYINYLIGNKNNCNTMLDLQAMSNTNYTILSDFQFNSDMYGGIQCNKSELEKLLSDNNIDFFYWLDNCHMFGTYYTIVVHDNDVKKTTSLLNHSQFIKFKKGY